ncbi:hypothetical protein BP00DRAFT_275668 [Aspergillus indologenus CBS 114.80]|uniref:Uncharacterized protein n=1 Tax=Aspergillus indologenus CBS 114.80 TaxID=1450541 RepID=A0A2V5J345_9EURO|nr:hypothetical protein BP00DRAFT_275668 [Aspergillus indologenus CBS 114.80]
MQIFYGICVCANLLLLLTDASQSSRGRQAPRHPGTQRGRGSHVPQPQPPSNNKPASAPQSSSNSPLNAKVHQLSPSMSHPAVRAASSPPIKTTPQTRIYHPASSCVSNPLMKPSPLPMTTKASSFVREPKFQGKELHRPRHKSNH